MAKSWIIRLSAGYGFLPVASEIAAVAPTLGGNIGSSIGRNFLGVFFKT